MRRRQQDQFLLIQWAHLMPKVPVGSFDAQPTFKKDDHENNVPLAHRQEKNEFLTGSAALYIWTQL